jgi:hypothetical protein
MDRLAHGPPPPRTMATRPAHHSREHRIRDVLHPAIVRTRRRADRSTRPRVSRQHIAVIGHSMSGLVAGQRQQAPGRCAGAGDSGSCRTRTSRAPHFATLALEAVGSGCWPSSWATRTPSCTVRAHASLPSECGDLGFADIHRPGRPDTAPPSTPHPQTTTPPVQATEGEEESWSGKRVRTRDPRLGKLLARSSLTPCPSSTSKQFWAGQFVTGDDWSGHEAAHMERHSSIDLRCRARGPPASQRRLHRLTSRGRASAPASPRQRRAAARKRAP